MIPITGEKGGDHELECDDHGCCHRGCSFTNRSRDNDHHCRWQVRSKVDELTQAQFRDVLLKRIEVYPRLWSIPQKLLSDWDRLRKPVDATWASELLTELIEWHVENGVFLSEHSYVAFGDLRSAVQEIVCRCNDEGYQPTLNDLRTLDSIYSEGFETHEGLATCLKNDLGSYKVPVVTVMPSTKPLRI